MNDDGMQRATIAPDAGYDGEGIALAIVRDNKAIRIGYLPQAHAKLVVDQGRLPARVYEEIGFFYDDPATDDAFPGSAHAGPEIRSPWKELAKLMEEGDETVHAGLCTKDGFHYWI